MEYEVRHYRCPHLERAARLPPSLNRGLAVGSPDSTIHSFLLFSFQFSFFLWTKLGLFLLFPSAFVFFPLITHIYSSLIFLHPTVVLTKFISQMQKYTGLDRILPMQSGDIQKFQVVQWKMLNACPPQEGRDTILDKSLKKS